MARAAWRRARASAQALGAASLLLAAAGPAQATATYTVQATTDADIGTVTSAASGDTVFRVDPSTAGVGIISGGATRTGAATARVTISVACAATAPGDCTKPVNIQLNIVGSAIGRARPLTRLTFTMGTAQLFGAPGPPGSGSFIIDAIGPNSSKTFFVGADFAIAGDDSGLQTGLAEADIQALAAETPATPSTGAVGRFQAHILRSIAISKTSDLVFGRISRPLTGLGQVTIDPVSGARTTSGALAFDTPTPSRAAFHVTGEGGQAITVTVPATFQMTGPQPMTVTTTTSITGSAQLDSVPGSAGAFTFGVGGSASIDSTTPTGDYSGSFTVTVAYN
jgi:hypothetical protein